MKYFSICDHSHRITREQFFLQQYFRLKPIFFIIFFITGVLNDIQAGSTVDSTIYISTQAGKGYFALSASGRSAPLYISAKDYQGVIRALKDLRTDIGRVTKTEPKLYIDTIPKSKGIVLVGTLGKSPIIDQLVQEKKLDITGLTGRWETFIIQTIAHPFPGVDQCLIIVGSDKRGTIYGIYDLSAQIGVSPWYWWADVPVREQQNLYVLPGRHTLGEPAVKYRGIFINDEKPALWKWANEKFGGLNHPFYEKVFELLLRMKANYLWPAMWGNAFNDDDTLNPKLADEYGIVMGTSHHEPMMCSQQEWERYGIEQWNYENNDSVLKEFWRQGIVNMDSHESIVTIGMRGNGDVAMSEKSNIGLLERIVKDQRKILAETTGKDTAAIPQLWALYKEVQDYYDKGMRVPDDVTLLLCDDNWGNIRRLPKLGEKKRDGGYGIYYHFDYVGGPRSYKWLNTIPITGVWEQMHLAYQYGVDRIWIVNVGDIKPMEFPIEFFLDYAWNPDKWPAERLEEYTRLWSEKQFGAEYASAIARIISKYTQYNGRRKPELLSPHTYSLSNYQEAETVVDDYNNLAAEAEKIYNILPSAYKDAYYQLVLYPVKACANVNDLYVTVGKNWMYAKQGRAATNDMANRAKALFAKDAELSNYYNNIMAGGKWNHMMDQPHLGYTSWQSPRKNTMPKIKEITIPAISDMGVAIEGSDSIWWPKDSLEAILPEFNIYRQQSHYFEIFNRGQIPFDYTVETGVPWLSVTPQKGKIEKEQRLWVNVDWQQVPEGRQRIPVIINGPNGSRILIYTTINNPVSPKPDQAKGFIENNGYVSIEAEHYSRAVEVSPVKWQCIPGLGRTLSGMTPFPVTAESQLPGENSPRLEYFIYLADTGEARVQVYLSPTLDFTGNEGLQYGISFDDEPIQIINMHADNSLKAWEQSVGDNIKVVDSRHNLHKPGDHVLKFWMVDPGLVLQKIVVDMGGVKPSYLGPPESFYRVVNNK